MTVHPHPDAHDHHHGHDHAHGHAPAGHSHAPADFGRAFLIGITLNVSFVIIEVVYGVMSHSLSLIADAGHNLGDVAGLVLAWVAGMLSRRLPTTRHTYGLRRTSVLAALANAIILFITIGAIGWEAIGRFSHPEPVTGMTVIVVAAIGILVNGITALLFMSGRKGDLNIRGAFLHMAVDAAISLGVVLAGVAMMATEWLWIDPAVSLIIAVLILFGTWGLLRDSLNLALDAVPAGVDPVAVRRYLETLPRVISVHDLHIWAIGTTETALTAHLVIPDTGGHDDLHARISRELQHQFHIGHVTIQVETGDQAHPCSLEPDSVV